MVSNCEDGFPARHRVGAHARVDGTEVGADVFGRAARFGVDVEAVVFGCFVEFRLRVGGC